MINGMNLSQIEGITQTHLSHYRKLNQIVNQSQDHFSQLDNSMLKIMRNRKFNHQRWKKFKLNKYSSDRDRGNASQLSKLQKIRMGKSSYNFNNNESPTSKAHNYYIRRKKLCSIENENPEIAKRIINVQGSFSYSKVDGQYNKSREILHRIERFPLIMRLTTLSNKKVGLSNQSNIRALFTGDKRAYSTKNKHRF